MAGLRFRKPLALATLLLCLSVAAAEAASACSPAASTELRAAGGDRRFQGRVSVGEDCSLVVDGIRWTSEDVVATYVPEGAAQQGRSAAGRLEFEQTYGQDGSATLRVALPPALPVRRVEVRDAATAGLLAAAALQQQQQRGGTVVLTLAAAHLEATAAGSSAARSLQAAGCSLTVDGQAHAFDYCKTITYVDAFSGSPNPPSYTFAYYYSLDTSGAAPALKAGVKAAPFVSPDPASNGGWVSFGIAKHAAQMQDASVAMVRSAPGLASTSMAGYVLPSSGASTDQTVAAAKGTAALSDTASSVQSDGTISAVFKLPIHKTAAQLSADPQLDFLWATGYLNTDGSMAQHVYPSYAGGVLTFAAVSQSPSASPSLAVDPPAESEGTPDSNGQRSPPSPVSAPLTPSASESPVSGSGSSVATAQNCVLSIGNGEQKFTNCFLQSGRNDFYVMYSLSNDTDISQSTLTMGINGSSSGYISVGFPTRSGQMTDATALILQTCATCSSGASLTNYWMSGTSESDVNPGAGQNPSQVPVTNVQAAATPDGQLVGSFEVKVSDLPVSARRRLLQGSTVNLPLIFAVGNLNSAGSPAEHFYKSAATVDLTDGAVAASGMSSLEKAHAWTSTIGWGVLIPSAIVMARSYKDVGPKSSALWFKIHRAVAASGFVLGTVGFGLGLAIGGGNSEYSVHRNLGIAVTVLGATQVTALVLRPAPGTKYRVGWQYWHHWVGRSAAVLAIANIYYGIIKVEKLSTWAWATYTGILVAIVAASVVKDGVDFVKKRRAKASAGKPADSAVELSAIQSMA